jgi:hypothetical protein
MTTTCRFDPHKETNMTEQFLSDDVTKEIYREWIEFGGLPRCAARTAAGRVCKNTIGSGGVSPGEFLAMHRRETCRQHGGGRS